MKILAPALRDGRTVCAILIASGSPIAVEVVGDLGFTAVVVDARHGPVSPYSHNVGDLVRAARAASVAALVRLPESTPGTINRSLNDGVDGVIVPSVSDATQAREVAMAARYPPLGLRGAAPVVRAAGYGVRDWDEYRDEANTDQLALCSLETQTALDAAPAILAVDGIDGVVIDALSMAMDAGGVATAPDVLDGVLAAVLAADESGKTCAVILPDVERVAEWAAAGCRLLVVDSDLSACLRAMRRARAAMGPKEKAE